VAGFFRNPEMLSVLKKSVFPKIVRHQRDNEPLRVWLPGCATGEDAYSIAITFGEFAEGRAEHIPIQIFATDSDAKAIKRASAGTYSQKIADDISPEKLRSFFRKSEDGYHINRTIRNVCIFASQNLLTDPPLSRMNLVVLDKRFTGLVPALQEKVIRNLHYSLKPEGLLVFASAQVPVSFTNLFKLENREHKIYSKISGPSHVRHYPIGSVAAAETQPISRSPALRQPRTEPKESVRRLRQELQSVRAYLGSLIPQHKADTARLPTAIGELQHSNEELASINEELQVTHEQLLASNEELMQSNEENLQIKYELENLLSSLEIPIVMVDRNLLIRRVTPAAKLLLKLIDADIGRPITDLALPADLELSKLLREAMDTCGLSEREVQDRTGCWYSLRVRPYRTVKNTVEGAIVTMVNIDQLKRSEEELRAACERAETAMRAKDEFLSVVSHELRTPLVSILGYTQLLDVNEPDASLVRRVVGVVERNSRMQLQLIEDLLDTTRVMSGKLKLDMLPVDIASVIRTALDVVQPAADAKGVELRSGLDPSAAQITGDPDRLQQTVWNLLSNAIKFTPKGGFVEVALGRTDAYVEISVHDTGKGIEPEFLPHVFERFRQRDMSSSRRAGGLGLGLSLVKHLVELHGGNVEVASAGADHGSTFTVRLPVRAVYAAPPVEHETIQAVQEPRSLTSVYALVVDDEQDVRSLLALTLESYGAKVKTASSGQEALQLLTGQIANEQFDVLICDIAMPEEDGYAVIQKVRALSLDKGGDIPALALTAYGRAEYRVRALEAGFQGFAVKPVKPDELVGMIESLIKQLV